jgi:heavy metal translocating P-type ATPase
MVAGVAAAIPLHLLFLSLGVGRWIIDLPLVIALIGGGTPLMVGLLRRVLKRQFGSDLLAGMSIITAAVVGQYLAGTIIVLMLAGGEMLEAYAMRTASGALRALARRMPTVAHVWRGEALKDIAASELQPGNDILVMPHEVCPADGVVVSGHGNMDESFLTGEPYGIAKAPGSDVLSGALNGAAAITLMVRRTPADSRYARIVEIMREAEQSRMRLRRLGDTFGAWMTPVVVLVAFAAWAISGDVLRFLAVIVVATPCPLIIAIPVAVIGTISLCARHGIVIRDAGILEHFETCQTVIFDKTGTLTVGRPRLTEIVTTEGIDAREVLQIAASLEQYSRHPLGPAVLERAAEEQIPLLAVQDLHEPPGFGLRARIADRVVTLTGRKHLEAPVTRQLPPVTGGLECIVLIDGRYAATLQFRDEPRADLRKFIDHLGPHHHVRKTILLTGDRLAEAQRVADHANIQHVLAEKSPEEKLAIVKSETALAPTLFVGDGVNDAPALMAATVGVALGAGADVAAAASGAVILEPSLRKLDELAHIARRLRRIVLQSAVGGLALSLIGVGFAAAGYLSPVYGAVFQEIIDLAAISNALRAAFAPKDLSDL